MVFSLSLIFYQTFCRIVSAAVSISVLSQRVEEFSGAKPLEKPPCFRLPAPERKQAVEEDHDEPHPDQPGKPVSVSVSGMRTNRAEDAAIAAAAPSKNTRCIRDKNPPHPQPQPTIFSHDPARRPVAASHLDADAFFVAVCQAADKVLRGKAVAVGGMRRGIIASASYEARRYGVYTPMPTSRALRVCPHLIVIPGDYELFEQFSRFMFSYIYDFTPEVEVCSIDEGYFDLTGNRRVRPVDALETIREAIAQRLKISVSQGLATSKVVSQIASKIRKPNGLIVVQPGTERRFLEPLPIHKMPGIGPKTESQLTAAGITRLGQLAGVPLELLRLVLGKQADTFRNHSQGIDPRPIVTTGEPAKSYGRQDTFGTDTVDDEFIEAKVKWLIDKAVAHMREDGKSARTLSLKLRYSDMEETERSVSLAEPGDLPDDFYSHALALLKKAWDRRVRLRMIRVKLSAIYNTPPLPDLFTAEDRARRTAIQEVLTQVRRRYGPQALMRAHDLYLRERSDG